MKIIRKDQIKNEEEHAFVNEFSILRDLDHPNIIKLHDLYQDDDRYYIVTEFCSGGELFARINKKKSFNEKDAKIIIK